MGCDCVYAVPPSVMVLGVQVGGTARRGLPRFDFRPAAIIERLGLRRPIYRQVAAYGYFGRDDLDLPWERVD